MMEDRDLARDRISGLPDPLLAHILSFIPTEEAVCTCILSKRWIKVWASLPILVFDNHKGQYDGRTEEEDRQCEAKFLRFLDGVMFNREIIALDTFKLTFSKIPCGNELNTHILVCRFLLCAVMCRPRVLSILIYTSTVFNLPDSIFTCTSIEEMSLLLETDDVFYKDNFLKPRSINLPFLKNLVLGYMDLNDDIMRMLITGCPILEELVLTHCWLELNKISSSVLKMLLLNKCHQLSPLMEISCPGVVSLIIRSNMYLKGFTLKNMSSLGMADFFLADEDLSDLRLLGGLSNVTSLKLRTCSTGIMDLLLADIPNCSTLKNLKTLDLGDLDFNYDWNLVACLLQHSTNLKDLTLHFYRPSEDATEEEFQGDMKFQHEYLEAVKISCPGKTVKLDNELVLYTENVLTTAKIIIL